jgi:Zn-dependent protease
MLNLSRGFGAAVGLLLGMILHEYMHARMALVAGDKTPKLYGRVTLNPKAHVDPVGTLILPGIFVVSLLVGRPFGFIFGYAKPVPLNTRAMKDRRLWPAIVALTGPATNFVLAIVAGIGLSSLGPSSSVYLYAALAAFVTVNVFLGIINALPIPPLDGSRVLGLFLSPAAAFKMEELSQYMILFLVVLFLFFRGVLGAMADPVCRVVSANSLPGCLL